jgi:hypothetical protein
MLMAFLPKLLNPFPKAILDTHPNGGLLPVSDDPVEHQLQVRVRKHIASYGHLGHFVSEELGDWLHMRNGFPKTANKPTSLFFLEICPPEVGSVELKQRVRAYLSVPCGGNGSVCTDPGAEHTIQRIEASVSVWLVSLMDACAGFEVVPFIGYI